MSDTEAVYENKVEEWLQKSFKQRKDSTNEEKITSLALLNNHFAVKLHQLLAEEEKGNVFFSPFSISTAVAMVIIDDEDYPMSELMTALGYDNHPGLQIDDIATIFDRQISLLLENQESYTLSCANSVVSNKDFAPTDNCEQMLVGSFKSLMSQVDFAGENARAVNQINDWVKEKTNGVIPKMVNDLDLTTIYLLMNAVYFKGTWKRQFKNDATFPQTFYNGGAESNAKQVAMMHLTETFAYYVDESMEVLKLHYIGDEVAMLVLLPRQRNGLEKMEAGLSTSFLKDLKNKLRKKKVKVCFPKFRLEYTKPSIPYFELCGVCAEFRFEAELTLASNCSKLSFSENVQEAPFVESEKIKKTAAETMRFSYEEVLKSRLYEPAFVADHPFAFVIYDTRSDLILFMGRVYEI